MKTMATLCLTVFCAMSALSTTVDGRFVVLTNDGSTYSVKVQFKTDVAMGMGGTTVKFSFDNTNLSFPASPTAGVDYSYCSVFRWFIQPRVHHCGWKHPVDQYRIQWNCRERDASGDELYGRRNDRLHDSDPGRKFESALDPIGNRRRRLCSVDERNVSGP